MVSSRRVASLFIAAVTRSFSPHVFVCLSVIAAVGGSFCAHLVFYRSFMAAVGRSLAYYLVTAAHHHRQHPLFLWLQASGEKFSSSSSAWDFPLSSACSIYFATKHFVSIEKYGTILPGWALGLEINSADLLEILI